MELSCSVRRATPQDTDVLVAHNCAMAHETEGKELEPDVVTRGVERLLHLPEHGFYLVAERDGKVVGSLMVTSEWSDWRDGFFWWVQSVYIAPDHRRTGIYRSLYDEVRTEAREAEDVRGLRLYVEQTNRNARAVYARLGMDETSYRLYEELL
ncbi:MAG: GNAT family N-acetyltransferase [Planctomycetota bacterium]|nr:GNAT family N-acetyltransferase [Planctomycetota bacterium]